MTEELADELEQIKSDTEAEAAEIVNIVNAGSKINIVCELPSGTNFSQKLSKPVEWKSGNAFVDMMEHYGLEPSEVGELVGEEVPIRKSHGRTELNFEINTTEFSSDDSDDLSPAPQSGL